jgi:hypothetical protein
MRARPGGLSYVRETRVPGRRPKRRLLDRQAEGVSLRSFPMRDLEVK